MKQMYQVKIGAAESLFKTNDQENRKSISEITYHQQMIQR